MNKTERHIRQALISAAIALACAAGAAHAHAAVQRKAGSKPPTSRPAAGRARPEKKPAADVELIDRIFDRWVEAQGGALLLAGIRSRVMRGGVEHSKSNAPGRFEWYTKSPNKSLALIDVPGAGQFIEAFDGSDSWMRAPFLGTFLSNEVTAEAIRRNAAAGFAVRYSDLFSSLRYRGTEVVEGRRVQVVEGTRGGRRQVMQFDEKDGLLVRIDFPEQGTELLPVRAVAMEKYARVDGVLIPIRLKQFYNDFTVTFNVYEVKHNVPIKDALFENPKAAPVRAETNGQ